jgi:hypothetical protein
MRGARREENGYNRELRHSPADDEGVMFFFLDRPRKPISDR